VHNEGFGVNWKTRRAFWSDRAVNEVALRTNLMSLATTRTLHVGNDPNGERYNPDLWTDEFAFSESACSLVSRNANRSGGEPAKKAA
jgi:hypothetical protein